MAYPCRAGKQRSPPRHHLASRQSHQRPSSPPPQCLAPLPGTPLGAAWSMGAAHWEKPSVAPLAVASLLHPQHGQYQSILPLAHVDKVWVMDSRWGLGRGLLSGLLNTTSGVFEAPAGG